MEQQICLSGSYEKYTNKLEKNSHSVGISMWDFECKQPATKVAGVCGRVLKIF